MFLKRWFVLYPIAGLVVMSSLARAEVVDVDPLTFYHYRYYRDGREDPRLKGLSERAKRN